MANDNKKSFGTVRRGANNPILTPSGNDEQPSMTIQEAIGASTDRLVEVVEKMQEGIVQSFSSVVSHKADDPTSIIKSFKESVDDKLTALLGAIYGISNAQPSFKSSRYLSSLGKVNAQKTFFSDLYNAVDSIELPEMNIPVKDYEEQLKAIEDAIKAKETTTVTLSQDIVTSSQFQDFVDELLQALSTPAAAPEVKFEMPDFNGYLQAISNLEGILRESLNKAIEGTVTKHVINDINVTGLEASSVQQLTDILSKTGELNVDTFINELSKLEALSNLRPVDEAFITSLVSAIDMLSNIHSENAVNEITGIGRIVEELHNIMPKLDGEVTGKEALKTLGHFQNIIGGYYRFIDAINEFDVKSTGDYTKVKEVVGNIQDFVNDIRSIKVTDAEINEAKSAGQLLQAVVSGLTVDDKWLANIGQFLRKVIYLTEKPSAFTKIGLSDRGLLWQVIQNVAKAAQEVNVTEKSVEGIGKLLSDVIAVGKTMDKKQLDLMIDNMYLMAMVTDQYHLGQVLSNISTLRVPDESTLVNVGKTFRKANGLEEYLSFKDLALLNAKVAFATSAIYSVAALLKAFEYVDGEAAGFNVNNINNALQAAGDINTGSLNKIQVFIDKTAALAMTLASALPALFIGKFAAGQLPELYNAIAGAVSQLNTVEISDDTLRDIERIGIIAESLRSVSASLAIAGAVAILAIPGAYAIKLELKVLSSIITSINEIEIGEDTIKNAKAIGILTVACGGVLLAAAAIGTLVMASLPQMLGFTVAFTTFTYLIIGAVNLATRGIEDAKYNATQIGELIAISAGIMLLGGAVMTMFPQIIVGAMEFALSLGLFIAAVIKAYSWASQQELKDMHDKLDDLKAVVGLSAGLMLTGGLFMLIPGMLEATLAFGVELAAFIAGVTYAYSWASQNIGDATENADKFASLVAISAATLLIGGLLFKENPWMMLTTIAFGVELAAFVGAVTFAYQIGAQGIDNTLAVAKDFAVLVGISAATLLIGGLLFQENPWMMLTTIAFGVELAAFVGAVTFAYQIGAQGIDNTLAVAKDFAVLVGISAATLLIGGLLFQENPWMMLTTIAFGVELAAFIAIIGLAYAAASKFMGDAINVAPQFYTLVGISAAVLLVGGAVMLIPGMPEAVFEFGWRLAAFVGVIGLTYRLFAKDSRTVMPAALALSALVAVSAATLLVGGMMMLKNEGLMEASIVFAVTTALFVGAFAVMVWGLGQMKLKDLATGLVAVFAITLIIDSFVGTFKRINEVANELDEEKMDAALWSMMKVIGFAVALVGVLTGVIAVSSFFGAGLLVAGSIAAAELALMGIVKLVDMTADAMLHIAQASNAWANMQMPDTEKVIEAIGKFIGMSSAITPLANPLLLPVMQAAKTNASAISSVLNMLGKSVQSFASLSIPLIDKDGKVIGVRKLEDSDFDDAADNIEKIITTVGGAIITAYKKNDEIFSAGTIGDIFGMETPFARVSRSCATMGSMIAEIAEGVRDYANFRIAIYDKNGKKIGTRPFTPQDFKNAANSIENILTVLGTAIITTYNKNHAMFEDTKQWWQPGVRTPFAMVVKATSGMGRLISSVAKSVRDYANMRINVYDKDGKVIGTREMSPADFLMAGVNVALVLTTLGNAIISTYKNNEVMFTDSSRWHTDADKTPFGMVAKAMAGTGKLISEGAKAVQDVLEMNIDWSKSSQDAITGKVAFVLGILANSILQLATGDTKEAFEDDSYWHTDPLKTPFGMVKQALAGTSKLIEEGIGIINKVNGLNVPNGDAIRQKVALALSVLADSIYHLATDDETKEAFEDDSFWSTNPQKTPFGMVKAALAGTSKLILEAIGVLEKMSKLNVNAGTIGGYAQSIVSALPNAILKATLFNANEDLRDWWNDDPDDDFTKIRDAYKLMDKVLSDVVKTYEKVAKLTTGDKAANVYVLSSYISDMLNALPRIFNAIDIQKDSATLASIVNSFEEYGDAIDEIVKSYSSIWKLMSKLGESDDTARIDLLGNGLVSMIAYMKGSLSILSDGENDMALMEVKVASFADAMKEYRTAITNLAEAFNLAPEDFTQYENVHNALKKINVEIAATPELTSFREETGLVNAYVKSINSLQTDKVDSLTNLANSLTTMSTQLGGLEGLTDVLSNKVSVVLATLADKIDESAKTINTAEKLQETRHKKINEALENLKKLMAKPLSINVTHKAEQENPLNIPPAGDGKDNSASTTGGNQSYVTTSGPNNTYATPGPNQSHATSEGPGNLHTHPAGSPNAGKNTKSPDVTTNANEAYLERKAEKAADGLVNTHKNDIGKSNSGISYRQAKQIAREEAVAAIRDWQSRNAKRGNGGQTGAKRNA